MRGRVILSWDFKGAGYGTKLPNGDVRLLAVGWWVRFVWGITSSPERFRWRKFYGHRFAAVRLWGEPFDSRIVGIQWRRAEEDQRYA